MQQLGIEMIPACSPPQARGRSERAFKTHQNRLVKELAVAGITEMEAANEYPRTRYLPTWNAEFRRPSREEGGAFVACPELSVLDYPDGTLGINHGTRELARYDGRGQLMVEYGQAAA